MKKTNQVYTTFIRTTPKKLWRPSPNPNSRASIGQGSRCLRLEEGLRKWEHTTKENEAWITGKVLECNPPKRLVLTWADPDDLADKSRVTFEIEAIKDQVCLTVTHGNFKAGSKMAGKVSWGWPRVLSSMKSYLETGKGLNVFAR